MIKKRKNDARRDDCRNLDILKRALKGEKLVDIARIYDITPGRVGQIVQREQRYYPAFGSCDNPKV